MKRILLFLVGVSLLLSCEENSSLTTINTKITSDYLLNGTLDVYLSNNQVFRYKGKPGIVSIPIGNADITKYENCFVLHVATGTTKETTVSSAIIKLDDLEVLNTSDFSKNMGQHTFEVCNLTPTSVITVEVRGEPGSYIDVWIEGKLKPVIPMDGLVANYPFNGNANDESGNGLNLTKYGDPTLTIDRKGNIDRAYYFNGNTDYFYHNDCDLLNPATDFTLNCWINSSGMDDAQDVIISTFDDASISVGGYQLSIGGNNEVVFEVRNSNNMDIAVPRIPFEIKYRDKWTMVTCIYTSEVAKLYLDGSIVNSVTLTDIIGYGMTNNFRIGTNPHHNDSQRMYKGSIDDVRIYNRALSELEITMLYNE
jgi:hypothetical protein